VNTELAKYALARLSATADLRGVSDRIAINRVCRGYSNAIHWHFFRCVVKRHNPRSILMLGAYFGRDMAYLRHFSPTASILGVDRFSDSACADWSADKRGYTWQRAGFGPAPSLKRTRLNFDVLGMAAGLVEATAQDFLRKTRFEFDFIYVDVAHDRRTTAEVIQRALPRLKPGGVLAGDDYNTPGVRAAVDELLAPVRAVGQRIWVCERTA
jgi:predicted O-methyltransferase YrrM